MAAHLVKDCSAGKPTGKPGTDSATRPLSRFLAARFLAGLCLWALLGAGLLQNSANAAEEQAPEEALEDVNAAIAQIQEWLDSAANNRSTLETELRTTTRNIQETEAAVAQNEAAIALLQPRLADLSARSGELELARNQQQDLIRRALRASYMSGRESYLKLLLNQEDPALSARMLRYYGDFNAARLSQIDTYRATLTELAQTTTAIATASNELTERQASLQAQIATLEEEENSRATLIEELARDMASRSGELEQLSEDRSRLEELIEEIRDAVANIPPPDQLTPFAASQGAMPWPVEGTPMNRFGATYSDGNLHRQGIVLVSEAGAAVRAVHPGRVVFSDWLRGSGLLVIVDHGDGYLSLYANNQSLIKKKGDWVNRNEALATAGSDGGMGSPGIYFEIRHNGEAQDPAIWCES